MGLLLGVHYYINIEFAGVVLQFLKRFGINQRTIWVYRKFEILLD